jgi:hypothetical protein
MDIRLDEMRSDGASRDWGRGRWLVRLSVLLALALEVVPIEADIIRAFCAMADLGFAAVVKVIFLGVILLPLVAYGVVYGRDGLGEARRSVAAVLLIVIVRLVLDVLFLRGKLGGE